MLELLRGLPESFWPRPCKRLRDWREGGAPLSSNTGAYHQARQRLPLSVVNQSCDRIFDQLMDRMVASSGSAAPAFFVDGTAMRVAHSPAQIERFPLSSNQHGPAHWPVVRVVAVHDVRTGLALRPEWGPMHGPSAVSEQQLLEILLARLPTGATLIADRNFGVFSVAWASAQKGHPVLLRLTTARAQRLAGGPLVEGADRAITWRPSREDRRSHPGLPDEASVQGRLLVRQVRPTKGTPFLLALFTTLEESAERLVDLYGQRWNMETDLRTLKRELRLEQLASVTPEMVAKEVAMAMAAYNLVRAVMWAASECSGTPPRGYSFTQVRRVLETFAPLVASASEPDAERLFGQMMYYVEQARLPRRNRQRSTYPRAVWSKGAKYPPRRH